MKIAKRLDILIVAIAFLIYGNVVVWRAYASSQEVLPLRVVFMNIGQGDAIYVEAPNGRQMLIDGGPDVKTLSELKSVMPFGDRSLDVIVITNPDKDHIGGFEHVLAEYQVGILIEPGTHSETQTYARVEEGAAEHAVPVQLARAGERIMLDEEHQVYFDILFPDRDVAAFSRNDGSVVGKLVYGKTSYLLMGDATAKTESMLLSAYPPDALKSDVLKLGHHGSRTSTSEAWVRVVAPKTAVYSAGCHNSYGHPHKEVIHRLDVFQIPHFGTCESGTIEINSDGRTIKKLP